MDEGIEELEFMLIGGGVELKLICGGIWDWDLFGWGFVVSCVFNCVRVIFVFNGFNFVVILWKLSFDMWYVI